MSRDGVFARLGGVVYRWNGWFGCQLESIEWRRAPAGTERVLDFGLGKPTITVTVWKTERRWAVGRVRTFWAVSPRGTHDEHNARIFELKNALKGMW